MARAARCAPAACPGSAFSSCCASLGMTGSGSCVTGQTVRWRNAQPGERKTHRDPRHRLMIITSDRYRGSRVVDDPRTAFRSATDATGALGGSGVPVCSDLIICARAERWSFPGAIADKKRQAVCKDSASGPGERPISTDLNGARQNALALGVGAAADRAKLLPHQTHRHTAPMTSRSVVKAVWRASMPRIGRGGGVAADALRHCGVACHAACAWMTWQWTRRWSASRHPAGRRSAYPAPHALTPRHFRSCPTAVVRCRQRASV
jgi:hypothetical protein